MGQFVSRGVYFHPTRRSSNGKRRNVRTRLGGFWFKDEWFCLNLAFKFDSGGRAGKEFGTEVETDGNDGNDEKKGDLFHG